MSPGFSGSPIGVGDDDAFPTFTFAGRIVVSPTLYPACTTTTTCPSFPFSSTSSTASWIFGSNNFPVLSITSIPNSVRTCSNCRATCTTPAAQGSFSAAGADRPCASADFPDLPAPASILLNILVLLYVLVFLVSYVIYYVQVKTQLRLSSLRSCDTACASGLPAAAAQFPP